MANIRYCRHCGANQIAESTSYLSIEDEPARETDVDRETGASIERVTVIMADDHLVVQHGLGESLAIQSEFEIMGQAPSREELVARSQEYALDVELMNMMIPEIEGGEAARQIEQASPRTQIIILTSLPGIAISRSGNRGHFTLKWNSRKR